MTLSTLSVLIKCNLAEEDIPSLLYFYGISKFFIIKIFLEEITLQIQLMKNPIEHFYLTDMCHKEKMP